MMRLINSFGNLLWYFFIVCIFSFLPTSVFAEFSQQILHIQRGLERLGYDSRPLDGLPGRITNAAIEAFCEDQGRECNPDDLESVLDLVADAVSEIPQSHVDAILAQRQTINAFLPWNRYYLEYSERRYGLHWEHSPGRMPRGYPILRLTELYWNYYYPGTDWLNYRGIDEFLVNLNWRHDAEYGMTLATDIGDRRFIEYISDIGVFRQGVTGSDGIFLDWWHDDHSGGFSSLQVREARVSLINALRRKLGDEALIIGNVNWYLDSATVFDLNGVYLELYKPPLYGRSNTLYTEDELQIIEGALHYYDRNLAYPRIIALEGWRQTNSLEDSDHQTSANRRMAKILTAMSIVVPENGYVIYGDNNPDVDFGDHHHLYYDFYSFDVGRPTSGYQQVARGVGFKEHDRGVVAYNITRRDVVFETSDGREITVPAYSGLFCEYDGDSESCLRED